MQIKRIYEPFEKTDGYRVLVDRLWPRGVSKEQAHLDDWAKNLAPSAELRRWFGHRPERFAEFSRRYLEELSGNSTVEPDLSKLTEQSVVTLLYAASDTNCNHAVVLREFLTQRLIEF